MNETKTVEEWAKEKKSDAFLLAAARSQKHWGPGAPVSEADFDAALSDAGSVQLGDRSQKTDAPPAAPETDS